MTISNSSSDYFVATEENQPKFTSVEQMKILQDVYKIRFEFRYAYGCFKTNLSRVKWGFNESMQQYRVAPGQKINQELLNMVLGKSTTKETPADNSLESLVLTLSTVLSKDQKVQLCLNLVKTGNCSNLELYLSSFIN